MKRPWLIFAVACGQGQPGGSAKAPGSSDSAAAETGAPPASSRMGFAAAATSWALPDSLEGFRSLDDPVCSGDEDSLHTLMDMDGDLRPDLVLIADCSRLGALGQSEWRVHLNDGQGFLAEALAWPLPTVDEDRPFDRLRDGACENTPDHNFFVQDMDGDRRPDLVLLSDCDPATDWGRSHWRVHFNTGAGFAPDGVDWAAPAELAGDGWTQPERDRCRSVGDLLFSFIDLTGDLLPDLVATARCVERYHAEGEGLWQVWRNHCDGFAVDPEPWALPTDIGGDPWPGLVGLECQPPADHLFGLRDMDGDEILDLVVTSACDEDPAWDLRWRVYPGTGAGYGDGVDWAVPESAVPGTWQRSFSAGCAVDNDRKNAVMDFDGDDLPDLALLGACYRDKTPAAWLIHRNLGDRFDPEPVAWWLPEDEEPNTWATMQDNRCNHPDDQLFAVLDLDGDHLPDGVATHGCTPDHPIGRTGWSVLRGSLGGR